MDVSGAFGVPTVSVGFQYRFKVLSVSVISDLEGPLSGAPVVVTGPGDTCDLAHLAYFEKVVVPQSCLADQSVFFAGNPVVDHALELRREGDSIVLDLGNIRTAAEFRNFLCDERFLWHNGSSVLTILSTLYQNFTPLECLLNGVSEKCHSGHKCPQVGISVKPSLSITWDVVFWQPSIDWGRRLQPLKASVHFTRYSLLISRLHVGALESSVRRDTILKKEIEICEKMMPFCSSAAISRLYRSKFKREIFKDLSKLKKIVSGKTENGEELQIGDLEIFENVAYVMACHADNTIPASIDDWLGQFDRFSIYEVLPQILEPWGQNMTTDIQAKKELAEANGK